jgi:hypothetical protein
VVRTAKERATGHHRKAAEKRWPDAVLTNTGIVLALARIAARQTIAGSRTSKITTRIADGGKSAPRNHLWYMGRALAPGLFVGLLCLRSGELPVCPLIRPLTLGRC